MSWASGGEVEVRQALAPPGHLQWRRGVRAGRRLYSSDYSDLASLPDDVARAWLEAGLGTAQSARQYQRWTLSVRARDLLAIEPDLAATEVIELDGGRLFFPDERAAEFSAALRGHWDAHP